MNRLQFILLTIASLMIATPATRADELSELVAVVAATVDTTLISRDVKSANFRSKNTYKGKGKKDDTEISALYLDGILKSMNRLILNERRNSDTDYDYEDARYYASPTLGRADFYRPVAGIITSRFGWRPQFQRMHHGVDLRLNIGDTVRAALSGIVKHISYDHNGYGNYVVMTHPDGMETVYGHLQYALVSQGQFVYAGQPLAIGGNTGNSTGPHLHFEARLGGIAVDPTLLFDFYGSHRSFYAFEGTNNTTNSAKVPIYSHQSKSLKKEHTYVVRYGDTLESVARQAGISVMRLCQLNMLDKASPLQVGRMLKLKP